MYLQTAVSVSWAGTIIFLLVSAVFTVYAVQGAKERKRAAAAAAYNARMRAAAEERRAAAEKAEKERAAAQRKQQRAERAAARERTAEERAARQAAKLAAARELAELKERALQAEKELRALKAAPVRAAKRAGSNSPAAPVQLSFDDIAPAPQRAETISPADQVPAGTRRYQLQASAEVSFAEYQVFGTVELDLDLSTFRPDAAFLLRHYDAFGYYLAHPHLLPPERIIDIWVGRKGGGLADAHFTVPAADLYAARETI